MAGRVSNVGSLATLRAWAGERFNKKGLSLARGQK